MQEMNKAVNVAIKQFGSEDVPMSGPQGELMIAAENWSRMSLRVFSGNLLRKAMLLSAALAEFANEAQNPS
jgi:hypothetical protein